MRILVVDDSVVFRSQIKSALDGHQGMEVIGSVSNGRIALQKLAQSTVDLITLDLEMPELNGIETISEIKKQGFRCRIIVFSSSTMRGSESAIQALAAGADDFVCKPTEPGSGFGSVAERIRSELLPKVLQFAGASSGEVERGGAHREPTRSPFAVMRRDLSTFHPEVIVVGSSTGGPPALEKLLAGLPRDFRVPILIAQHMPPFFTASLAKRLEHVTGLSVAEGKTGDSLRPGQILVAPGNYHMAVRGSSSEPRIEIHQEPPRNSVRPAVDVLFESASDVFKNRTLGIVLTGMGEDGLQGCKRIKTQGGGVMIQDRKSCVVFGMPGAVFAAEAYDEMADLDTLRGRLLPMGT